MVGWSWRSENGSDVVYLKISRARSLLTSFSSGKKIFYNTINNTTETHKRVSTFKTLFKHPPHTHTHISADNFASFFTEEAAAIGSQVSEVTFFFFNQIKKTLVTK